MLISELDPWTCLTVRNSKRARDLEEAHLSGRNARSLSPSFNCFPNLQALWLNNNRLTSLETLHANFRLRELYVEGNLLTSLESVSHLRSLQVLNVKDNKVSDLSSQLGYLHRLVSLRVLALAGNPVASEPRYWERVITAAVNLHSLDCIEVSDAEYDRAVTTPESRPARCTKLRPLSKSELLLLSEAENYKRKAALNDSIDTSLLSVIPVRTCTDSVRLPRARYNSFETAEYLYLSVLGIMSKTPCPDISDFIADKFDLGWVPNTDLKFPVSTDLEPMRSWLKTWKTRSIDELTSRIETLYRLALVQKSDSLSFVAAAQRLQSVIDAQRVSLTTQTHQNIFGKEYFL